MDELRMLLGPTLPKQFEEGLRQHSSMSYVEQRGQQVSAYAPISAVNQMTTFVGGSIDRSTDSGQICRQQRSRCRAAPGDLSICLSDQRGHQQ